MTRKVFLRATIGVASFMFVSMDVGLPLHRPEMGDSQYQWVCRACSEQTFSSTTWEHWFAGEEMQTPEPDVKPKPSYDQALPGIDVMSLAEKSRARVTKHSSVVPGDDEAGNRDCRKDISKDEPSCHNSSNKLFGKCNELHGPCGPPEQLQELATVLSKLQHITRRSYTIAPALAAEMASTHPNFARVNVSRNALQVIDCRSQVVSHIPLAAVTAAAGLQR